MSDYLCMTQSRNSHAVWKALRINDDDDDDDDDDDTLGDLSCSRISGDSGEAYVLNTVPLKPVNASVSEKTSLYTTNRPSDRTQLCYDQTKYAAYITYLYSAPQFVDLHCSIHFRCVHVVLERIVFTLLVSACKA